MRRFVFLVLSLFAVLLGGCEYSVPDFDGLSCHPKPFSIEEFRGKEPYLELDCGGFLLKEPTVQGGYVFANPRIYEIKEILRLKERQTLICRSRVERPAFTDPISCYVKD